jgi:hypothetical protein
MARMLRKGRLILEAGSWFIQTEIGRKIPLPDYREPLLINSCGSEMVRFSRQPDRREKAARCHGAVVLYRFRRHGKRCWIKYWGHCPSNLTTHTRIIQLTNSKVTGTKCQRYGPRLILRRAG